MTRLEAIKEYQCPGCAQGLGSDCATECDTGIGCGAHCPGTMVSSIGTVFLGMPKGFDRRGHDKVLPIHIFESFEALCEDWKRVTMNGTVSRGYDVWNVPVWKYLDEHGSTLVRGLSPRVCSSFLHVILEDCRHKINCHEVTKEMHDDMD